MQVHGWLCGWVSCGVGRGVEWVVDPVKGGGAASCPANFLPHPTNAVPRRPLLLLLLPPLPVLPKLPADPHPGNLLATTSGDLVYLDFGMMSEAPPSGGCCADLACLLTWHVLSWQPRCMLSTMLYAMCPATLA